MTGGAEPALAPGLGRALARGLALRCPRCGGRRLFRRWLIMADDCPTCGLHFERVEGYWLGAVALNLVLTEGAFVIALVVWLAATWPDVPWAGVLVAMVALNVAVPLAAHPFTRTIWVAGERHFSKTWWEDPAGLAGSGGARRVTPSGRQP